MNSIDSILEELVETYHNPTPGHNYIIKDAKADIKELLIKSVLWGGNGGEPYINDAEFILDEQTKRINSMFNMEVA